MVNGVSDVLDLFCCLFTFNIPGNINTSLFLSNKMQTWTTQTIRLNIKQSKTQPFAHFPKRFHRINTPYLIFIRQSKEFFSHNSPYYIFPCSNAVVSDCLHM